MSDQTLHKLAKDAGVDIHWRDVTGVEKTVSDDSLRALLAAIDLPAATDEQIRASQAVLELELKRKVRTLITGDVGRPVLCPSLTGSFRLRLESGSTKEGILADDSTHPGISEPGYHILEANGVETHLAIAPLSAFKLDDIANGEKLWGLAVQLYALRRSGDGGFGDFEGLGSFVRAAASHGADAVAISPVHAQFTSASDRFGPYAPSNRAALNVLHISEPTSFVEDAGNLVDWPAASAAKIRALRKSFESFNDIDGFDRFVRSSGSDLELHAVFETINQKLLETQGVGSDWRFWPKEFQSPTNPEVTRFKVEHAEELRFHVYLQYRADSEMRAAQQSARASGMKVGLIADLAVGTDPGGSHSWSRQSEVLAGVEVGAPPDAINRAGQSWGITAFSPRGLRNSGFSAFIEMLRHALRHAGGVRIDHVMGLARLWLVPHGRPSSEGAYLRMPMRDLMRLVRLESHRHRAIILGEDLGTLPEGFQTTLDQAGISGLRVLWFEKSGNRFNPPSSWSRTAVAMTSTHDLPTVAGWWRGQDILWREKLGIAGGGNEIRAAERAELWDAFVEAGVTAASMPGPDDTGAVADAACAFLGKTASTLAILPIEDALGEIEQPNLPGTTDEHPNWRRRLPDASDALLNHPEIAARLAKLSELRKR
jgi:4-alpha-glucanotransferase